MPCTPSSEGQRESLEERGHALEIELDPVLGRERGDDVGLRTAASRSIGESRSKYPSKPAGISSSMNLSSSVALAFQNVCHWSLGFHT
jgi:hypothetical protein